MAPWKPPFFLQSNSHPFSVLMLNILLDPNDLLFLEFLIEFAYKGRLVFILSRLKYGLKEGAKGWILIFYLLKHTFLSVTSVMSHESTAKWNVPWGHMYQCLPGFEFRGKTAMVEITAGILIGPKMQKKKQSCISMRACKVRSQLFRWWRKDRMTSNMKQGWDGDRRRSFLCSSRVAWTES